MRLHHVDIQNFRSIANLTITFEPSCRILVGINESGKSNILYALRLLDPNIPSTNDDRRLVPPSDTD